MHFVSTKGYLKTRMKHLAGLVSADSSISMKNAGQLIQGHSLLGVISSAHSLYTCYPENGAHGMN